MGKIVRLAQKIFAGAAGFQQIAQFGTLAAGSPAYATDPSTVQATNWTGGWPSAILGGNSPAIEDMNAYCYLMSSQVAYILQAGVAEYDAATTYYINSLAQYSGVIYQSIVDANLANTPAFGSAYWAPFTNATNLVSKSSAYPLVASDGTVECDASGGAFSVTLVAAAAGNKGKIWTFKKVDTTLNRVQLTGVVDGWTNPQIGMPGDSVQIQSDGTNLKFLKAPQIGMRAQKNNQVTVSNNSQSAYAYDTTIHDYSNGFDGTNFSAPIAGTYAVSASMLWTNTTWGVATQTQISIAINTSVVDSAIFWIPTVSNVSWFNQVHCAGIQLNSGDSVRIQVFQNDGGNKQSSSSNPNNQSFNVFRVGN